MLKTYNFKKQPVFSGDYQETTIQTEDFHKIMRLANSSLNCTCGGSADLPQQSSGSAHQDLAVLLSLEHKFGTPKLRSAANNQGSPLSFLSSRLSQFTKATKLFSTRDHPTKTNVAKEFHEACDGKTNTLVIIKSGQYIAGGYTEVAWSSPPSPTWIPLSSHSQTFLFSVNKQKIYHNQVADGGIRCYHGFGPCFGGLRMITTRFRRLDLPPRSPAGYAPKFTCGDIAVDGEYRSNNNYSSLCSYGESCVQNPTEGLFGSNNFTIDEYEVYKLE